jgi:transposase
MNKRNSAAAKRSSLAATTLGASTSGEKSAAAASDSGPAETILAIDMAWATSVACVYSTNGGEHTFRSLVSTPQAFHDLFAEVQPGRVVIEISSQAGWVVDLARAMGLDIQVVNTADESFRWRSRKRKTDRDDALKLARMSARREARTVHVPNKRVRQWRQLIRWRWALVERSNRIKTSSRAILIGQAITFPSGKRGWSLEMVERLKSWAKPLAECGREELWRGMLALELEQLGMIVAQLKVVEEALERLADERVRLLRTIPGVGPRLAECVAATIDDPHRFTSAKEVGCYIGLTPRRYQSGVMKRDGKISGEGSELLRTLLVEVCWLGLAHNAWMRSVYERVRRGAMTRKKKAIVAVARRLIVVCWAMLRDNTSWKEPALPAIPSSA